MISGRFKTGCSVGQRFHNPWEHKPAEVLPRRRRNGETALERRLLRSIALSLAILALAACTQTQVMPPPGPSIQPQPSLPPGPVTELICQVNVEGGPGAQAYQSLTVRDGDRLRFQIEADRDLYVYVLHVGASGQASIVAPRGAVQPPRVSPGRASLIPASGAMRVGPPAGRERVILVAGPNRIAQLDDMAAAGEPTQGEIDAALSSLEAKRPADCEIQKSTLGNAVRFRMQTRDLGAPLIGEFSLEHVSGLGLFP